MPLNLNIFDILFISIVLFTVVVILIRKRRNAKINYLKSLTKTIIENRNFNSKTAAQRAHFYKAVIEPKIKKIKKCNYFKPLKHASFFSESFIKLYLKN